MLSQHMSKVTLIALDVLHPCAYLWVGQSKQMSDEKAAGYEHMEGMGFKHQTP